MNIYEYVYIYMSDIYIYIDKLPFTGALATCQCPGVHARARPVQARGHVVDVQARPVHALKPHLRKQ